MSLILSAIQFDPNIRGVLVVLVGVVVLCGSVYLLLATNTGVRNGFLIALAGLFGWMFSMGLIWWIYGIGLRGTDPSWIPKEINFTRDDAVATQVVQKLPASDELPDPQVFLADYLAANPELAESIASTEGEGFTATSLTKAVTVAPDLKPKLDEELNGWRILSETDSRRGDAVAAADTKLAAAKAFGESTSSSSYTVKDVFFFGGKEASEPENVKGERSLIDKAWRRVVTVFQPKNPPLYAAITVQKNTTQLVAPGEAPPPPKVDESADVVTVVVMRNLGTRRLIPFLFTLFSGIVFFVLVWMLHNRDKRAMQVRGEWDPAKALPAEAS
ncbi:MAG: hypothetical protein ACOYML_06630 [Microthrixaceae bacterium]